METSKELFTKQGYHKTTIRQIVSESGILIGSIYHFFKNKDAIFLAVLSDVSAAADQLFMERYGHELAPELRYSALFLMQLTAVDNDAMVNELFYEAYSTASVFEAIVKQSADYTCRLFTGHNPDYSEDDFYLRALTTEGIMYGMVANRYFSKKLALKECAELFLDTSLVLYHFSKTEIKYAKHWLMENFQDIVTIAQDMKSNNIFK